MAHSPTTTSNGAAKPTSPVKRRASTADLTALDQIYPRLSKAFPLTSTDTYKRRSEGKLTRLDDSTSEVLFDLLQMLNSSDADDIKLHYAPLLKLLLYSVYPIADGHLLRQLSSLCVSRLIQLNRDKIADVYSASVQLMTTAAGNRTMGTYSHTEMTQQFSTQYVASPTETLAIINKHLARRVEVGIRYKAVQWIDAMLQSTEQPFKSSYDQSEACRLAVKMSHGNHAATQHQQAHTIGDNNEATVKVAAIRTLHTIIKYSADASELLTIVPALTKQLTDADITVRAVYAQTLGQILAHVSFTQHSSKASVRGQYHFDTPVQALQYILSKFTSSDITTRSSYAIVLQHFYSALTLQPQQLPSLLQPIVQTIQQIRGNEVELRQACACLTTAVERGLLQHADQTLLEAGAKHLLSLISSSNKEPLTTSFAVSLVCELLRHIIESLDSVLEHSELRDPMLESLLHLLPSNEQWLREQVAHTARSLAIAAPSHIATWLSVLHKIVSLQFDELLDCLEHRPEALQPIYNSMHGHVCATAAIVSTTPTTELGVSDSILDGIWQLAEKLKLESLEMAERFDNSSLGNMLIEIGWLLINATISVGAKAVVQRWASLHDLWQGTLSAAIEFTAEDHLPTAARFRIHSRALSTIISAVSSSKDQLSDEQLEQLDTLIEGAISTLSQWADQKSVAPLLRTPLATFKAALYDALLLQTPANSRISHIHLCNTLVNEFATHARTATSLFDQLLNQQHTVLNHSVIVNQVAETMLDLSGEVYDRSSYVTPPDFVSSKTLMVNSVTPRCAGGVVQTDWTQMWTAGTSAVASTQATDSTVLQYQLHRAYHVPPATRAIDSSILLFAQLFATQADTHKEQIVQHFMTVVEKVQSSAYKLAAPLQNSAAVLLAVCQHNAATKQAINSISAAVSIFIICTDLFDSAHPQIRRCAAETLGYLALTEEFVYVERAYDGIVNFLANKEPHVMATAAYALSCMYQYGAAANTAKHIQFTIAALQSLSRDAEATLRVYIMYAMLNILQVADNRTILLCVQPVLTMMSFQSMHDIAPTVSIVYHCIGSLCSQLLKRVYILQATDSDDGSLQDIKASVLRIAKYWVDYLHLQSDDEIQVVALDLLQAVTQCGGVVTVQSMQSYVMQNTEHRSAAVRQAAFKAMLTAIGTQYDSISPVKLIPHLLSALNASSYQTQAQIKAIVQQYLLTLPTIDNSKVRKDKNVQLLLLDACESAFTGRSSLAPENGHVRHNSTASTSSNTDDAGLGDGIVDENELEQSRAPVKRDSSWQVRAFALDVTTQILRMRAQTPQLEHELNLSHAKRKAKYPLQFLVQHISLLLQIYSTASSDAYEVLKIKGTAAIGLTIEVFGPVKDSDRRDALSILAPYSAQLTASVTQSLKPKSDETFIPYSPLVRQQASYLAVTYLLSGITDDDMVIKRIISLLLEPVQSPEATVSLYSQFDASMSQTIVLSHLAALLRLYRATAAVPARQASASHLQVLRQQLHECESVVQMAAIRSVMDIAQAEASASVLAGGHYSLYKLHEQHALPLLQGVATFATHQAEGLPSTATVVTVLLGMLVHRVSLVQPETPAFAVIIEAITATLTSVTEQASAVDLRAITELLQTLQSLDVGDGTWIADVVVKAITLLHAQLTGSGDVDAEVAVQLQKVLVCAVSDICVRLQPGPQDTAVGLNGHDIKKTKSTEPSEQATTSMLQAVPILASSVCMINDSTASDMLTSLYATFFALITSSDTFSTAASEAIITMTVQLFVDESTDKALTEQLSTLTSAFAGELHARLVAEQGLDAAAPAYVLLILLPLSGASTLSSQQRASVQQCAGYIAGLLHSAKPAAMQTAILDVVKQHVLRPADSLSVTQVAIRNIIMRSTLAPSLSLFAQTNDQHLQVTIGSLLARLVETSDSAAQDKLLPHIMPPFVTRIADNDQLLQPTLSIAASAPQAFRLYVTSLDSASRSIYQARLKQLQQADADDAISDIRQSPSSQSSVSQPSQSPRHHSQADASTDAYADGMNGDSPRTKRPTKAKGKKKYAAAQDSSLPSLTMDFKIPTKQ